MSKEIIIIDDDGIKWKREYDIQLMGMSDNNVKSGFDMKTGKSFVDTRIIK